MDDSTLRSKTTAKAGSGYLDPENPKPKKPQKQSNKLYTLRDQQLGITPEEANS